MAARTVGIARLSEEEVEPLEERHPALAAVVQSGDRQATTIAASAPVLSVVELLSQRLGARRSRLPGCSTRSRPTPRMA